jgi:hypothetical protein
MNPTKDKVLRALSGPFLRRRDDPIGDLGASIEQNAKTTTYRYRDQMFIEPTELATDARELNEALIKDCSVPLRTNQLWRRGRKLVPR